MTKFEICDKISFMDKKIFFKTLKYALGVVALTCLFFASNLFYSPLSANATSLPYDRFLTPTKIENTSLTAPIDVYYGEEIIILQNDNTLLFSEGDSFVSQNGFTAIKQVKNLNYDYFLLSDGGSIYKISKNDLSKTPLMHNSTVVGGNYFDINDKYLITAYSGKATVYGLNNGNVDSNQLAVSFDVAVDKPICINQNNDIFYVSTDYSETTLLKVNASNISAPQILATVSPDKMIADGRYVYYISSGNIYRVSVSGGDPEFLSVSESDGSYDLGKLVSPSSLCFKGGNLLISDTSVSAVQEFAIESFDNSTKLSFTGYAIANGKTAYNRLSSTATDIEKYGDYVAAIDTNKLTVIKTDDDFDGKNKNFFINYALTDLSSPSIFSLGNDKILLGFGTDGVKLLDFKNGTTGDKISINGSVKDVCYRNKIFYVISDDGSNTYITSVSELDGQITATENFAGVHGSLVCTDMDGNIYFADENYIYKNDFTLNDRIPKEGAKKIITDLVGTLFMTDGTNIKYYDEGWQTVNGFDDVKTFSFSFDKKDTYILKNNDETIYLSTSINNYSIDSITVPSTFVVTGESASIDDLKLFTLTDGSTIYSIEKAQNNFKFISLAPLEEEYVYISDVQITARVKMIALAGQNGIYLTLYDNATEKPLSSSDEDGYAFITTGAHIYYKPIITLDGKFALVKEDVSIRLNKGVKFAPVKKINVLGRQFYYASFDIDGTTVNGYIPQEFTVDVLYENFEYTSFTIGKVNYTSVYSDESLTTELTTLDDGTDVRLVYEGDGYYKILFSDGSDYIYGFISEDAVKVETDTSVRNVVILLVTFTSVCVSAIYFILRKKSTK